jgi:hypothetical protein
MQLYLKAKIQHPSWFQEVLDDLNGNFHVPHGKYFFDEEIIGDNPERLEYCINMLNITISRMEKITKRAFFDFIRTDLEGTWCDISNEFYDEEWLNDDTNYKDHFITPLIQLRRIMTEK